MNVDAVVSLGLNCEAAWNLRRCGLLHPERLPFNWTVTPSLLCVRFCGTGSRICFL